MGKSLKNICMNISRIALVVGLYSLCACSSDEGMQGGGHQSMTFAPSIEDLSQITVRSRTTVNANNTVIFQHNDVVSIYAWTGSKSVTPPEENRVVNNGKITYDRNTQTWSAENQMLWKNPVEKHYFMGLYPYSSEPIEDFTSVPFEITDATDMASSDPLVALRTDGLTSTSTPIDMQFKHVVSKINVTLSYRDQFGSSTPTVDKVVLGNVTQKGNINCLTQSITATGNRNDFELPTYYPNKIYLCYLIPQDGINTVTITIAGKDFVYTHPTDIPFESGKITTLNLTVGQDGINLGSTSIDQWGDAGSYSGSTSKYNQAAFITDQAKLDMIYSLGDLEGNKGRIYEMDYTADYKLDDAIASEVSNLNGLMGFVYANLYDRMPSSARQFGFGAGCSAFAVDEKLSGDHLMGRNYDFCHKSADGKSETDIAAIVVHTAPASGKKSVSVVDGYWLGLNKGFYTDCKTDLSMLMATPYAFMDGINEDGFAIGVLHLGGNPTQQTESSKSNIFMNVAMRLLLDKAADVDEAVNLLNQYNMQMTSPAGGNFHFYMADAKGKYAIVEYVCEKGNLAKNPWKIDVLTGNDIYRYVTNFYVSDEMANTEYGNKSTRGKARYETMQRRLWDANFKMSTKEVKDLLEDVSQAPNITDPTSHTQWSSIYNLSKKTLTLWLLREYYGKEPFEFKVK